MRGTIRGLKKNHHVDQFIGGDVFGNEKTQENNNGTSKARWEWLKRILPLEAKGIVIDIRRIRHYKRLEKLLLRAIKERDIDPQIIYERSAYGDGTGIKIAKLLKIPYILESDILLADLLEPGNRSRLLQVLRNKPLERKKLLGADKIAVMSQQSISLAENRWGVKPENCFVKGLGFDVQDFPVSGGICLDQKFNLKDKFVVAYIGYFREYQNIPILFEVAEYLKGFTDIQILIVGGGELLKRYKKVVDGKKLNNITFTDLLDKSQMGDVYSRINLGVITDNLEHMYPVKYLEFVSLGIPALVPDYPVFEPFFENSELFGRYSFTHKDGSALAKKIIDRYNNESESKADIQYTRDVAICDYSWEACSQRLESVINNLVEKDLVG